MSKSLPKSETLVPSRSDFDMDHTISVDPAMGNRDRMYAYSPSGDQQQVKHADGPSGCNADQLSLNTESACPFSFNLARNPRSVPMIHPLNFRKSVSSWSMIVVPSTLVPPSTACPSPYS